MIDLKKIKTMLKKSEALAEIYGYPLNLGFSGGKDSVVLKYFADYYGIKYVGNFNNTQIEQYKGMIPFLKENYPEINIVHPDKEHSFFELMKKRGLPSIFRRWCCEYLKHSSPKLSEYRVNIMGVRGEESAARMKRGEISVFGNNKRAEKKREALRATFASTSSELHCEEGKDKVNIYPIFDLLESEIWEIIKVENLIIPDIYNNITRMGCAFCPFASKKENFRAIQDRPSIARAWIRVLGSDGFIKRHRKIVNGRIDGVGLFYLHVNRLLSSRDDIERGIIELNSKGLFGGTGYEEFKEYLKKCKVL